MTTGNQTDEQPAAPPAVKASHTSLKRVAIIVSIVTALGWLLFFYKMGQTSEMALRYSTEAQESVGTWVLVLLAMSIGSVVLLVMARMARKRASTS